MHTLGRWLDIRKQGFRDLVSRDSHCTEIIAGERIEWRITLPASHMISNWIRFQKLPLCVLVLFPSLWLCQVCLSPWYDVASPFFFFFLNLVVSFWVGYLWKMGMDGWMDGWFADGWDRGGMVRHQSTSMGDDCLATYTLPLLRILLPTVTLNLLGRLCKENTWTLGGRAREGKASAEHTALQRTATVFVFLTPLLHYDNPIVNPQPSNKTFKIKRILGKKQKQNRPIPQWIRLRTDNKIRLVCVHWF